MVVTGLESVAFKHAVDKVDSLLTGEVKLLAGLRPALKDLRNEFETMRSFLQDADAGGECHVMRTSTRQIREVMCDIGELLDVSMQHVRPMHGRGFRGFARTTCYNIKHCHAQHQIAIKIQRIEAELHNIYVRKQKYATSSTDEGSSSGGAKGRLYNRHVAPLFVNEAELVGINRPREELIKLLVKGDQQLKVISVVGMGGVGKTTLAKKVYDDERVKRCFQCHAWIAVTPSFKLEGLLNKIISKLYEENSQPLPERMDMMEKDQLMEIIYHYLSGKRYVIVFDDIWHIGGWNDIKSALPDDNYGSRVLVTTRKRDPIIASYGHLYNLEPLSQSEAWLLFCRKAFCSIPGEVCPQELEDTSREIVELCGGLPLAITAIGGLLLHKENTLIEWKTFLNNLNTELSNNKNLEDITVFLSLSYIDLPEELKYCFLYFSIFPRNYPITCITLIRLWIAEGFIEAENGNSMEEVAENYLKNLIDRSMVQGAEYYDYGRMRSCKVHDIIREIIFSKAQEENFSKFLISQGNRMNKTIRRLSIHNAQKNTIQDTSLSHLRALFIFGPMSMTSMHKFFSGCRSLRVLSLEGAPIEAFPAELGNLLQLRYLSLRNTRINKLSSSLGKLKYLETLDLKGTYVSSLPKGVIKLQNLRHLLAYHYNTGRKPPFYYTYGVKLPNGIGTLTELQKLSYLEVDHDSAIVKELGNLTQLKRLGIVKLRERDGIFLCTAIEKMMQLRSFSVTAIDVHEHLDLKHLTAAPPFLQRLYLRGCLQSFPDWVSSLQNLVRMRLRWSKLREDALAVLQDLPNLAELALIQAFDEAEMCCGQYGFQKLQILDLEQLDSLNCVRIVDGAMPNLRKMIIRKCEQLQRVPIGIRQLTNLKELHLIDMPEEFVRSGGQEIEHIQKIQRYDSDKVVEEIA